MIKRLILFFVCSICALQLAQAQDSSRIRISLLTCTPGDELYSIFGHSALRVVDSNSVTDIVYNYGTFNFDDEGFYLKFIQGKLLYYISIESFQDFKYLYQMTNRGITEQVLLMTDSQKVNLQHALIENLKEENRYYKYDFFFDNCTTRLRDLIVAYKRPHPLLPAVRRTDMRFREAIHEYLDNGDQPWSKLGIDILLGARTDRVMTPAEQQFLPDNLMMALDSSKNSRLVQSKENLYPLGPDATPETFFTPLLFFSLLFLFFIVMHALIDRKYPVFENGLDGLLFFCTGFLGVVLLFMWFGTDHIMTKNNYNLLWAWPTHLVASFALFKHRSWLKIYFLLSFIGACIMIVSWFFLPQEMNKALLPFVALLARRSWVRYQKKETY